MRSIKTRWGIRKYPDNDIIINIYANTIQHAEVLSVLELLYGFKKLMCNWVSISGLAPITICPTHS